MFFLEFPMNISSSNLMEIWKYNIIKAIFSTLAIDHYILEGFKGLWTNSDAWNYNLNNV